MGVSKSMGVDYCLAWPNVTLAVESSTSDITDKGTSLNIEKDAYKQYLEKQEGV